jgi:hypothetical protein
VGKASRGKKERSSDRTGQLTATGASRAAHRLREQTQQTLTGNPWVQMTLASNMNNVVAELHAVLAPRRTLITTDRRTAPRHR